MPAEGACGALVEEVDWGEGEGEEGGGGVGGRPGGGKWTGGEEEEEEGGGGVDGSAQEGGQMTGRGVGVGFEIEAGFRAGLIQAGTKLTSIWPGGGEPVLAANQARLDCKPGPSRGETTRFGSGPGPS